MADAGSVTGQIRERLATFSPAERKVARALLSGTPTVGLDSSAKLAEWAGVSGPTVIRFVNRLGFATFAEFKSSLRTELDARVLSPVDLDRQRRARPADTGRALATLQDIADVLDSTISALSPDDITQVAELLGDRRRRVVVTGGWFSQVLASYLVALLQRVRPGCALVEQNARSRTAALADADRHTLAVVFDYRRYERESETFARAMHARGARVVLFTDPWLSPISDIAEAIVPVDMAVSGVETLAPAMAVVESVVTEILDNDDEQARDRFVRFNEIADDLR
ncbi:MurR/RpiR family transcriptional regulator [Nonomuraea sp. NN258]|uniref:MurR/RpiR family transcriptional regulator n=1 Tax=Nonomuraea antri TaxID=2730852 RepID=UPI00156859ED|nr:MurR/RpiR family transcriptional regulator [Nonomuraea antri]NRQ35464.1 MurR/RpiR family transcriptional regulator [Nonomuraea antri]